MEPCLRHALAGREYDPGCYACQRDHEAREAYAERELLTAMQVVTVESIFVPQEER